MIIESYKLPNGKFLDQIEPFKRLGLPDSSIIHKKIPGCGATTLELLFERNSIIIEPNVPVIKGKCKFYNGKLRKHKRILGVYEGIEPEDIKFYVENRVGYKKILTTPEGFKKIKEALGDAIYTDYFILFDECEKAIQDIDFRDAIINPIDEFFAFNKKAFVSATPLMPSDPRFANFKQVVIEPDYDFKEDICVLTTNNVAFQLKLLLDKIQGSVEMNNRKCFIFLKSTKRIKRLIKGLNIQNESSVYCSETSAKELHLNGIENVYSVINDKFTMFNFLTSRFFSAVDIDYTMYACNPIIIMLSDVVAVAHTTIDPVTESIQISGRFRKPVDEKIKVLKDIYHISNFNSKFTSFTEEGVRAILEDKKELHQFITKFQPKSDIEYINAFIDQILELNGFKQFIRKDDGTLNCFMIDNFVNQERVKGYYRTSDSLLKRYEASQHFNVVSASRFYNYELTDYELAGIADNTKSITINEFVSNKVKEIVQSYGTSVIAGINLASVRLSFPRDMAVIDNYGIANAAQHDYSIDKISKELEDAKGLKKLLPIIKFCKTAFVVGRGYTGSEIEAILTKGINETGITDLKPNIGLLRNAFKLSDRKHIRTDENGGSVKGYFIEEFLHNF